MYEVKYSAADKKKLKTFEWNGRGSATAAMRAMKMVAPRCQECQTPEVIKDDSPTRWTWMKDCPHNPYWGMQPKVTKVPKIVDEIGEDGKPTGDYIQEDVVVRTRLIAQPNIVEIPMAERFEDGQAVQKAARHGFRILTDAGIAPMCQMYGCGKAWPTIGTDDGIYCSREHAQLCVIDFNNTAEGVPTFLTINNPKLRKQELAEVNV